MLAAGVGVRLESTSPRPPPKVLLRFGGKTLLERHLQVLKQQGIEELVLGVGYEHTAIESEILTLGAQDFVRTVFNEKYRAGNIVTLWTLRDELCCGDTVLLMDADILYDEAIPRRLINSPHRNCLLLDRNFESGDEAVKICIRNDEIVEFRKWSSTDFDYCGESVGMFKLSSAAARMIVAQTQLYLSQDRFHDPYEEAIRDVLLTSPRGTFAVEDITGLPWIEIDFAADIARAESTVLPRILARSNDPRAPGRSKGDAKADSEPDP